jgi:quinol monooxygenase YgiN
MLHLRDAHAADPRMDTPAVVFTVRLKAAQEGVRRELAALLGPVAAQPGCQRCVLTLDARESNAVTLIEEWATRADLERHFRSDECRRLLLAADLSAAPPEFSIDTVSRREGLEAIARSRSTGGPDEIFRGQTGRRGSS